MNLIDTWHTLDNELQTISIVESILSKKFILKEDNFFQRIWKAISPYFQNNKIIDISIPSKCISHLKYNPKNKILTVQFTKNNRVYEYNNVEKKTVANLLSALSKGKQFLNSIKGKYQYKEI